jgi:hypothetical protein
MIRSLRQNGYLGFWQTTERVTTIRIVTTHTILHRISSGWAPDHAQPGHICEFDSSTKSLAPREL